MSLERPGEVRAGVDIDELATALRELRERVDLLATPAEPRQSLIPPGEGGPRAFMVMPFGHEDLQVVYEEFIKPALERKCHVTCIRGDDIFGSNVVMDDVSAAISTADLVVADLTGKNANVFYEVGIGHALSKPVLLLAQTMDDVPFDLRHRRVLLYEYTPLGVKHLEETIVEHVKDMLNQWHED